MWSADAHVREFGWRAPIGYGVASFTPHAMRLYSPAIGQALKLTRDWTCPLELERRNASLIRALNLRLPRGSLYLWAAIGVPSISVAPMNVTVPAATVLRVERIDIRRGRAAFNSVTFRVVASPAPTLTGARFWASLDAVNQLDVKRAPAFDRVDARRT